MRILRTISAVLAVAIGVGGCDDSAIPTAPDHMSHPVAAITVDASVANLALGETTQFTATAECEHGIPLDRDVVWTVDDPALASVDADGRVTARELGRVRVRAALGSVIGGAELTVTGAFIGPLGGVARSGDGNVVLEVPADALASTTEFIIRPAPEDMRPDDPRYIPGTAYTCEPDGLQLREMARMRIRFDPALVPDGYTVEHLRLRHRERERTQWDATDQNRLQAENMFEGAIEHLSVYALVAMKDDEASGDVVGTIRITVWGDLDLVVGGTTKLSAKAYDENDDPRSEWLVTWTTEDPLVADVFQDGTVVARGAGTAKIVATYGGVSQSVTITVLGPPDDGGGPPDDGGPPDGGHDEGFGNNLSWPVVFAEGVGLTGLPVTTDPGVRPTADEGITVDALPFFYSGNVPDYGSFYEQLGPNVWQAEWLDGSLAGAQAALVYWGDNLTHQTWNTHSVIRVEHVLEAASVGTLMGYNMSYLYGSGPDEMQGADGTTGVFVPTIYSVVPRLTLQKLDQEGGSPVFTAFDGAAHEYIGLDGPGGYGAEVNVAGKVIYGYNFMIRNVAMPPDIHKYGWWRITFSLDDSGMVGGANVLRNVWLQDLGDFDAEVEYVPQIDPVTNRTWLDIYIDSARGGGSGGGGHSGAGDGG